LHLLEIVSFSGTWDGTGYPLQSFSTRDDRVIDLPVLPGTYDLVYRRWASGDTTLLSDHDPLDAYAAGNRILRTGVIVGATGSTALGEVDLAPGRIAGVITYGGSALPTRSRRDADIGLYLRAHDTGTLHLLEIVSFSGTWDGMGYPLQSFSTRDDRVIDLPVLPGTYDLVYRRWASGTTTLLSDHDPLDAYAAANRLVGSCVEVAPP
jgi:hypothetical protein